MDKFELTTAEIRMRLTRRRMTRCKKGPEKLERRKRKIK